MRSNFQILLREVHGVVRKSGRGSTISMFYSIFMIQFFKVFWRGTWGAPSSLPLVCNYDFNLIVCYQMSNVIYFMVGDAITKVLVRGNSFCISESRVLVLGKHLERVLKAETIRIKFLWIIFLLRRFVLLFLRQFILSDELLFLNVS